MNKIICSLEEWDSILDYYRPNASSKTWYIKEKKQLDIPLMWGYWNILTEDKEMFQFGHLKAAITPNFNDLIEYVPKDKIGDSSHIYIINVYNSNFFRLNREIGFSCISQNYLEDIRNGKSKILIFLLYEGYSGREGNDDFEIIEEWRINQNLPINSIYYVNGNLLSEEIIIEKKLGYKAIGIQYFEPWNKYKGDVLNFNPTNDKYLYLSYNRTFRHQRVYFLWELYKKNLLDKGLVSFYEIRNPRQFEDIDVEFLKYLMEKTPIVIDRSYDLYYNLACNIHLNDYENTFISIITESLVDKGTLFFSEKIWKPIMVGHPFMLFGNQYSLKYLKKLGYKTFDKWIDERYDDEPEMTKRSQMIIEELNKFKDNSIEELKIIREEMKEVCLHNQNIFKELYIKNYGDNDQSTKIKEIMLEIWSDINKI